jgi:hypothetical protein
MTDNIVTMPTPMNVLADKIRAAFARTEHGRQEWIDGTLELATALSEARERFQKDDRKFSVWLAENDLDAIGKNDRAALISMADQAITKQVLQETKRSSWFWIWREEIQPMVHQVMTHAAEPTLISEPPAPDDTAGETEQVAIEETNVETEAPAPGKRRARKLDKIGNAQSDTLVRMFEHHRIFTSMIEGEGRQAHVKLALRYIAKRCVEKDYPPELFTAKKWSLQFMYPHLPMRLLDRVCKSGTPNAVVNIHTMLIETERRFMGTPEFGVKDQPFAAYNKAYSIFQAIKDQKDGVEVGSFDASAVHVPKFASDEGKPPVIVRGTQVWPVEIDNLHTGYGYDDLRCAYKFAEDVLLIFGEPRDASMATKSLTLRHLMSWLPGGYNSRGCTIDGVLRALKDVVAAYGADKGDVMRGPAAAPKADE